MDAQNAPPPLTRTVRGTAGYGWASNLHTGNEESLLEYENELEGLSKDEIEAHRAWRMVELLVGIGDRICATADLDTNEDVWVPDDLKEMVG